MNLYPSCPIVYVPRQLSLFGQRLVTEGWLNFEQMYEIESDSRQHNSSLIQSVESSLSRQLSVPMRTLYHKLRLLEYRLLYGVNFIELTNNEVSIEQVISLINSLISIDRCRRHRVIPLRQNQDHDSPILIGMVEPDDLIARDAVSRILRERNLSPVYIGILPEHYQRLLEQYLDAQAITQEQIALESSAEHESSNDLDTATPDVGAAPVIGIVNKLLVNALQEEVSSLHFEPQEQGLRIRARKNGKLKDFLTTGHLPKKLIPAITARLKIMADLDIAERRLPQTGNVRRIFSKRDVDIRVSTLPSRFGEAIVLKVINHHIRHSTSLADLIPNSANLSIIRNIMARSSGVLIVTGTSGLEKEMLCAFLNDRKTDDCRVITIEETIDQTIVNSTQVLSSPHQPDRDQLSLLLSCIRQEPDIILLDTLDDHQVAAAVFKAAKKQHLIITTMAALDPISAMQQLLEMGIAPYVITRSLLGIVGQQFVRRLCDGCQTAYTLTPEERSQFDLPLQPYEGQTFYRPAQSSVNDTCSKCGNIGYQGQIAILEILQISDRLRQLLNQNPSADTLRTVAQQGGMQPYLEQAITLSAEGLTSLEEIEHIWQLQ
ncbi:MAG: ATPase, T2SS/T4P/T4SS family [Cyanobacteria bacterium P01_H01_bin.21]